MKNIHMKSLTRQALLFMGLFLAGVSSLFASEADLNLLKDQMAKAAAYGDLKDDAPDFSESGITIDWDFITGLASNEDKINYGGEDTTVGDAAKAILNGSTFEKKEHAATANQVIYDHLWSGTDDSNFFTTNNLWILISAFLVFIMHLGFCTLESGLCQKKNTVNILFKNCWIIAVGLLTYYFWGFNAHYPGEFNNFFAFGSAASYPASELLTHSTNLYNDNYTWWTDFIFQAMFAATAATIVSGAVAERVKLGFFMIFSVLLVLVAYPLVGAWHWGGGWLQKDDLLPGKFHDFAGSTVVHAFGGFAALGCVLVLGPRRGKYTENGIRPILGHSMPLAAIGVFLLFLGWFGFNGGSVLSAESHNVSLVFVTTSLAAVGGAVGSILAAWIVLKKPDLSMALNGFLAGLVGITAGADVISTTFSIVVGLFAGILCVFSILFFDKLKIDDPVGAISVHGICGIWGTLAVGIFGGANLIVQLIGIIAVCAFAFVFALVSSLIGKAIMGIRVDEQEEAEGLDIAEHGSPAYAD